MTQSRNLNVAYGRKIAALERRITHLKGKIPQRLTDWDKAEIAALRWAITVIEANKTSAKSILETHRLEKDAITLADSGAIGSDVDLPRTHPRRAQIQPKSP
jgi:hypothetical protein